MSLSPAKILCAAKTTDFNPDPQTLLIVNAGTVSGIPAAIETCLATFCPCPAPSTFPKMTSSTKFASKLASANAPRTATCPNSTGEIFLKAPPNFPTAVLFADTMTTSVMKSSFRFKILLVLSSL